MDKVTYCAVNGITLEDYDAISEAMRQDSKVSPKVLDIMEALINKRPRTGRRTRVGAARAVPVAYTR